jgi:integrase
MNILDLVNNYSEDIWNGTQKHHNECVSRLHNFAFKVGNLAVSDIEAPHVYEYIRKLKEKGFSDATCNRHIAAISKALRFARDSGFGANYFKITTKKEESRLRFFSEEELAKIEAFCKRSYVPQWFADMCIIARYTGMRHSEVLKIANSDEAYVYEEDGNTHVLLHKTKNGDAREIAVYKKEAAAAVSRFAFDGGLTFYYADKFYILWNEMRRGIAPRDKQFVFHVFRHTVASKMANELNLNSDVIGKWLGHKRADTTKKYIHIKKETIQKTAALLSEKGD